MTIGDICRCVVTFERDSSVHRVVAAGQHRFFVSILAVSLFALAPSVWAADLQRGGLLYENHCVECHDSRAHLRNDRRANSLAEVREWVDKWSSYLTLSWSNDERGDVASYVYRRFYSVSE